MEKFLFFLFLNLIFINPSNKNIGIEKLKNYRQPQEIMDSSSDLFLSSDSSSAPTDLFSDSPTDLFSNSPTDLFSDSLMDSSLTDSLSLSDNSSDYIDWNEFIPDNTLLGFDGYQNTSELLTFNAYIIFKKEVYDEVIFNISINNNTRVLQEDPNYIICNKISNGTDNLYKYNCSINITGNIIKVEITGSYPELNQTDVVKEMCKNIQNLSGDLISDKGIFIINNCKIENQEKNVQLSGILDENISYANSTLRILDNNSNNWKFIPMEIKNQNESLYKLEIIYKEALNSNLSESFGKVENGKNFFLFFEKNADPILDYKGYSDSDRHFDSKSNKSNGLPPGAIVGIVIACVVVLVLAFLLVFKFGKKSNLSSPSKENINSANNTIGISSSSDAVNK